MNYPGVSIVILNWNGLEDTSECVESLKKIDYSNYKVIVVDNGSKGNDVGTLRERFRKNIHLIENDTNYGFAEGSNIGIRYALASDNPDYVLLLNNDTIVASDCLIELVKVAEEDSEVGVVGAKILSYHANDIIQSAGARINWWTGEFSLIGCNQKDAGQFDDVAQVDWVSGAGLLIRRKTIERIGLLYQGYFAYCEETEWCARAKKAGYKITYAPKARIWHKRSMNVGSADQWRTYYMIRNRFLFMKRNARRLQLLSFLVWFLFRDILVTTTLFLAGRRDMTLIKTFYKGVYDGIRAH